MEMKERLEALIADGLTFANCVAAFSAMQADDADAQYLIEKARDEYHREGEVEIDDNTLTSGSDDRGDYVLAWVWVYDDRPEEPLEHGSVGWDDHDASEWAKECRTDD